MKVIVSSKAERDLFEIYLYLAQQSPQSAERLASSIDRCLMNLSTFPFSGTPRPNIAIGIRSLLVHPYIIFHVVRRHHITILRVVHGSRNLAKVFPS
jgi:toxin ParE1/3/4